jgi:hypothetical protein
MDVSLQQWLDNGWLRRHQTSRQEVGNLLAIVDRDLRDARGRISPDWRFGIAYNAALKLCTILLYAEGYRPEMTLQHFRTIQGMPEVLGAERKKDAAYLDSCRTKRNTIEYTRVGEASETEAKELVEFCAQLKKDVLEWLRWKHPECVP